MKNIIFAILLLMVPVSAFSQEDDPQYNKLVDQVLALTGALEVGEQLSQLFVSQMTKSMSQADKQLPDEAYEIIAEEVNATISDSINSKDFHKLMYPIYAQNLSKSDLEAMVAFYQTPAGGRIAAAMPIMSQQGIQVGQVWGQSLGADIGQRVLGRLREKGYIPE